MDNDTTDRLTLSQALARLLNSYSRENESNTPDFVLATYLLNCLEAFEVGVEARDQWYGVELRPGAGIAEAIARGRAAAPSEPPIPFPRRPPLGSEGGSGE